MANFLDGLLSGKNAFTQTTASFAQPAVGANVTVPVDYSGWAAVGMAVFLEVGGNYQVVSIPNDSSIQIKNLGSSGNAAVSASVPPGRMAPAGAPGANGTSGTSIPAPDYIATSNIALTGSVSVDGANPATSKIVLCVGQTDTTKNGYWIVNTGGAWTRPSFYNSDATIAPLVGLVSGTALNGATNKGKAFYSVSGTTLLGAKAWFEFRKQIEIDVTSMPWGVKPDNVTDNAAALANLTAYSKAQVAAGYGVTWLLPPGNILSRQTLELSLYVSMRGCGPFASRFRFDYDPATPLLSRVPIHGLHGYSQLNAPGGVSGYASYKDFAVQNDTCSWQYGGMQNVARSTNYSATPLGTLFHTALPSERLLRLVTAGTTAAHAPIGELSPVGSALNWGLYSHVARMLGTASAAHATIYRHTAAGPLGTTKIQISTDGGVTWGAVLDTTDADFNVFMLPALGADVGVKVANSTSFIVAPTATTTASYTQPAVNGTVAIAIPTIDGGAQPTLIKHTCLVVPGGGLYAIQSIDSNTQITAKLLVSYASGTIAAGKVAQSVCVPQPRVEVLSASAVDNDQIDMRVLTDGQLGASGMGWDTKHTNAYDPYVSNGAGYTNSPTPSSGAGSAYVDITMYGATVRCHSGIYLNLPANIPMYSSPSFNFSFEVGTRVTDGSCVWEIVEATDAIRLDGSCQVNFDNVPTVGGSCGYAISQSNSVHIGGNFFTTGVSLACIWIGNGDMRYGEGAQFANAIEVTGAGAFYSDGLGILDDGGLGHLYTGSFNYQACNTGWCHISGLFGGIVAPAYIETNGGRLRNALYHTRRGDIGGVLQMTLLPGYAGSIFSPYFLDCYAATFEAYGLLVGGSVAGFGGLASCEVVLSGRQYRGLYLSDAIPNRGEIRDTGRHVTWRSGFTEVQRQFRGANFAPVPGSNNNVPAFEASDIAITTDPGAKFEITGIVPPPVNLRDGTVYRVMNLSTRNMSLAHANAFSLAANRINCLGALDLLIPHGGSVELVYVDTHVTVGWYVRSITVPLLNPIRTFSGTTDTPLATDAQANIQSTGASAVTVTLDTRPAGFCCTYSQEGAGAISFVNGTATKYSALASTPTSGVGQTRTLFWKDATNVRIT